MEQLRLSDWRGWHDAEGRQPPLQNSLTDRPGASLPSMLRRRLNESGRATCDILAALDPEAQCPLIHASRHGDACHTLSMLDALERGDPLSPTRFSMSVHNAVLGVHSIAQLHHRPIQALGACGDEFDALLHEATGYLVEGHHSVIAVFSEGPLPSAYEGRTEHPGYACAVGMRLTLSLGRRLMASHSPYSIHPTPLDVISWLNGDASYLDGQHRWQMEAI